MNINISTLRKVKGIGEKTLERIIKQHYIDNDIKAFKSEYIPSDTYRVDKDINLWQGDCLDLMNHIPDKSVDMILADLPYGTTVCSWDTIIPFEPLWSHYKRIIKDNGAIALFGSEPFSTKLRNSNLGWYKYDWYWIKSLGQGFLNVKKQPLKSVENIVVFYKSPPIYNPQGVVRVDKKVKNGIGKKQNKMLGHITGHNGGGMKKDYYIQEYTNYPRQELYFGIVKDTYHPTQKPVDLLEYLIKTYTNKGMLVLDNTMGSGSTGVACKNLNRKFIGIELDKEYFNIAKQRINN